MVIANLAIFPTSEGVSVSRYVKKVIQLIQESGLNYQTGGMSTTIEAPDLKSLFEVIEKAHKALIDQGVKRIHVDLHIDHRLDKNATIASKLKSLNQQ